MPKLLTQYVAKIVVLGADYPNFSFRQLPSASADFRLRISCVIDDDVLYGGGRKPKPPTQYVARVDILSAA